jgi:hypothetical protein
MARTIMAVLTNPSSPEQEAEYNAWYNEVHLKELMEVPGIVGATRYKLAEGASPAQSEHRYLALYEVDGDPATVMAELGSRSSGMNISPALDAPASRVLFWEPVEGGSVSA